MTDHLIERIVAQLAGRQDKTLRYLQLGIEHGFLPPRSLRWYGTEDPGFAPLLPAGMHTMSMDQLRRLAVDDFPASTTRLPLWIAIERFHASVRVLNVASALWLAGSLLSTKPEPADADLVLVLQLERVVTLDVPAASRLSSVLEDAKRGKKLDVALLIEGDLTIRSYLQGFLGFCDDRIQPRGIAVVPFPAAPALSPRIDAAGAAANRTGAGPAISWASTPSPDRRCGSR